MTKFPRHVGDSGGLQRASLTIGLMGHSVSSYNLGVGALTAAHVAILQDICDQIGVQVNFMIFGWPGDPEPYIRGNNIENVALRTRAYLALRDGLYSAVRRCDVICDITGGDSFTDIYGVPRFIRDALGKAIVLIAGRPLLLSPQTIGPFRRGWTRFAAIRLMRSARAVVSRDKLTTQLLNQLGLGSKVVEATDVAFRLPYETQALERKKSIRVGINISGLLFNGGYTRSNMFALAVDYPKLARDLVGHFAAQPECEVHLISHVISDVFEVEDDYQVAQRLAKETPGVIVAPRFRNPSEAKSYIATMDFFCGSRMHACIAAFSSGVAVLPIAYSRKFAGVFGSLGYLHVADCQTLTGEHIMASVIEAFANRDSLRQSVKIGLGKVDTKLAAYEVVARECILEAIGKRP